MLIQWGDVIAAIAQPVANLVGLENCSGCKAQQADLNAGTPFLDTVIKRMKGQYAENTNQYPNHTS